MAGPVIRAGVAALVVWPLWSAAMGPDAPFTAPALRATTAAAAATELAAGLRGVRLGNAPAALIDGQWIAPGQTVRGARLAAVRIDGALLRHPGGRVEQLSLFPPQPASPQADLSNASTTTDSVQGPP